MKKYFLFVGPQKTASTWLYDVLSVNNKLKFPKQTKETFFWDRFYIRGIEWYLKHFEASEKKIMTEVGPTYFSSVDAINRVHKFEPNTKIIITLRDPAQRTYSMYLHHLKKGRYRTDFWKATRQYPEILESSYYKKYIKLWIEKFGKENVLITLQNEIKENPSKVIEDICKFLDIPLEYDSYALNNKSNEATMPKNVFIAGVFTKMSLIIRKLGLYNFVNFANKIGIKKLIYSSNKVVPMLDKDLRKELIGYFIEDIEYVEYIKKMKLDEWKK